MEAMAVALGGALGSLGRWGIGGALHMALPDLPAGTFVANVLAGLIIGAASNLGAAVDVHPNVKAFVTVGLCGGLSTFSTFSNETFNLIDTGDTLGAVVNIAANVGVCLLAVYLGRRLGAAVA